MTSFLKSIQFALSGLKTALLSERNFRIQWLCAFLIILLNNLYSFTYIEKIIFSIVISAVLSLELINTAIEAICDMHGTAPCQIKKEIKDFAASAVFLSSLASLFVFFLILSESIESLVMDAMMRPFAWISLALIAIIGFFLSLSQKFDRILFFPAFLLLIFHAIITLQGDFNIYVFLLSLGFHAGYILSYFRNENA